MTFTTTEHSFEIRKSIHWYKVLGTTKSAVATEIDYPTNLDQISRGLYPSLPRTASVYPSFPHFINNSHLPSYYYFQRAVGLVWTMSYMVALWCQCAVSEGVLAPATCTLPPYNNVGFDIEPR